MKKWKIFPICLGILLLATILYYWDKKRKIEYAIIHSIIERLGDYQAEIESWGYQVSVLPKMTEKPNDTRFMRYYLKKDFNALESVGPILVLTNQKGEIYCFYYGFDQMISERTYKANMMLSPISQYAKKQYKEVLKTVRLQISKRNIKQAPLYENMADINSQDYYDMFVLMKVTAMSLENESELSVYGGGFFETNYSSNNFKECRWWGGIDSMSANRYSDYNIKQEYSAEQLLKYYQQGLELQNRLIKLYYKRQER